MRLINCLIYLTLLCLNFLDTCGALQPEHKPIQNDKRVENRLSSSRGENMGFSNTSTYIAAIRKKYTVQKRDIRTRLAAAIKLDIPLRVWSISKKIEVDGVYYSVTSPELPIAVNSLYKRMSLNISKIKDVEQRRLWKMELNRKFDEILRNDVDPMVKMVMGRHPVKPLQKRDYFGNIHRSQEFWNTFDDDNLVFNNDMDNMMKPEIKKTFLESFNLNYYVILAVSAGTLAFVGIFIALLSLKQSDPMIISRSEIEISNKSHFDHHKGERRKLNSYMANRSQYNNSSEEGAPPVLTKMASFQSFEPAAEKQKSVTYSSPVPRPSYRPFTVSSLNPHCKDDQDESEIDEETYENFDFLIPGKSAASLDRLVESAAMKL